MRILNSILFAMMVLFIAVQYNDPDGPVWALIYAVPTIWAGLAAFKLQYILNNKAAAALGASLLAGFGMVVIYWPRTPGFWKQSVWWETETAREGMGVMIGTMVLLIVLLTVWRTRKTMV